MRNSLHIHAEASPAPLPTDADAAARTAWYAQAMERLLPVVEELSLARDLEEVMAIVRTAARALTGADGATFVLRDVDKCYYADEDAISPLWKGQRFPMSQCISGWVMLNAQPAVIEDIYVDERIPAEAYRPTFVKSLVMVPIRAQDPVGAIGNYWSAKRPPLAEEVAVLQALANVTAVTMQNIELYRQLENKMDALEKSNEDLSRFAWIASHDLKSPLRAVHNLSLWLEEDAKGALPEKSMEHLQTMRSRVRRMENMLDRLLEYALLDDAREQVPPEILGGAELAGDISQTVHLPKGIRLETGENFRALQLPRIPTEQALANLVDNAAKHHGGAQGLIRIDGHEMPGEYVLTVKDDGPGIAPEYHDRIFEMFQTLQPRDRAEGSGMGLALVKKLLARHKGSISVASAHGEGACFTIRLPKPE
ncbi:MAG: GAF domain-containing protein [Alphaproteobacteria bacterium]|nr:GAF domain-containing protein [Alphaproteobacteria bacterium]